MTKFDWSNSSSTTTLIVFILLLSTTTVPGIAGATDIVVSGDSSTPVILNPSDVLTVLPDGNLTVSGSDNTIESNGPGSATITNAGTISQTGSERTIYSDDDGGGLTLDNLQSGVITSQGNDVMKMSNEDSVYIINNQGLLSQDGPAGGTDNGQALDLRDVDESVGNSIVNGSTFNSLARIAANGDDALRPGSNTNILNYGTIITTGVVNTHCPDYLGSACDGQPSPHDAIDVDESTNVSIENYGLISGSRHAITADDNIFVINRSSGLIVGRNGSGVGSDNAGIVINYGTIRGDYAGAGNVYEFGDGTTTTTADNGDGDGVDIDGIAHVENYGFILGTGAGGFDNNGLPNSAEGIAAGGGVIINGRGALIQGEANGILIDDGSGGSGVAATAVTNAGTITGQSYGISIVGSFDNQIINSGTIFGSTYAIQTGDGSDTLVIQDGSKIIGMIDLGGGINQISVPRGNYTLNFGSGNISSSILHVHSTPYVVSGDTVVSVDPTAYAAQEDMLNDLTRVISDGVDARLVAARLAASTTLTTSGIDVTQRSAVSEAPVVWAQGLAQGRNEKADGADAGFDTELAGMMIGVDDGIANMRVGGYLGASAGRFNTDTGSQSIDTDNYFGGLYSGLQHGEYFLNVGLMVGLSSQSSDRKVMNNMAEGGVEHAKADYSGVFVSPAATIGKDFALPGAVLTPSLRARYSALFLNDYEEHGAQADLSTEQRTVQAFDARAQIEMTVPVLLERGVFTTSVRLGADATVTNGEDVEVSTLGQSVAFDAGGDNQMLQGFAGLDLYYLTDGGVRFFAGAQYGIGEDQKSTAQANAGIELKL